MKKTFRGLVAVLLLFFSAAVLPAQEAPLPETEEPPLVTEELLPVTEEQPPGQELFSPETGAALPETGTPAPETPIVVLTPEQNRINMDIKTSNLTELAAWSRSLGLGEGGTRDELARRLLDHFKIVEPPAPEGQDNRKIITIESARSTEYFKIEAVDEEYARLSGEVKISLKDGDAVHRITAWNVLFNRTRNIITASGGVEYIKEQGETVETFRGESITVDLDNWSSVFLGGVSERTLQSDSTTYLFAGSVISRDEEEVTVLNRATISNANNPESLWSLNASRVWLLPGSDFAIFNAVLKVGEIPVLYVPFFYYPADEVIFHPVIGSRTREGSFIQTTTYILGRPKASSSSQSSLARILGNSADMEKKREGLFLRSTGKKAVDPGAVSLTAMLDYYANLGGYLGLDFSHPGKGILGALTLSLGVGLSRTLAYQNGAYTPFFPDYDGTIDWNKSNLFSMEVPFRYRLVTGSSISGTYGSFTWNIPFYSDPLVDSDFVNNRTTEMDWINMIQKGAAVEAEETSQSQTGSPTWSFTGSVNPKFPNMQPFINSISIQSISSSISFSTIDKRSTYGSGDIRYYSPSSFFFAPNSATLYSLGASMSGTPLRLGGTAVTQPVQAVPPGDAAAQSKDPLADIGVPRSPFETPEEQEPKETAPADTLVPPAITQTFTLPGTRNVQFSIDYSIAPSSQTSLKFDSNKWLEYSDIDWGNISNILFVLTGTASTNFRISHSQNLFTGDFSFIGNGTWRQFAYLNEEAEDYSTNDAPDPVKIASAKLNEYRQSNFSTSYGVTTSVRPLYLNPIFASSSIDYSLKGTAVKSAQIGTGDEPEWEFIYGEWNNEKVDSHLFSANLSALVMDKTQSFKLSAALPPKDSSLGFDTAWNIWITSTTANWRITHPGDEEKRKLEPFHASETITFGTFGNFKQTLDLDTEAKEITSLTSALSLTTWGLTVNYTATRTQGVEYVKPGPGVSQSGWVTKTGDPSLQSNNFTLTYAKTFSKRELWENRINFSVNTSSRLFFDLQRYTNSSFSFTLGFTLGIVKFLDLSMSATSSNSYIYRYFRNWPMFSDADIEIPDGPQNNLFLDLFNSFRFDNEELRKSSGFKMGRFNITATHYLGDWTASLTWSMAPYRPTGGRQFEINNVVTFAVRWTPISEIKSEMSFDKTRTPEWIVK